ncbi:MAG: hypothetical protein MSC30_11300 [Gaiellaceae bacterium MAG52_C11]|nr:hypothetical protein [Candidatus Gaiellasilicea maunaloa]
MIFAEQYLTVLQRLLIEHAAELDMDYEPARVDLARTIRAIFAAASVTGAADAARAQKRVAPCLPLHRRLFERYCLDLTRSAYPLYGACASRLEDVLLRHLYDDAGRHTSEYQEIPK